MTDNNFPELYDGGGAILSEKRRKMLTGALERDLADSTIRSHKMDIRENVIGALIDLEIIANYMGMGDLRSLGETIHERESGRDLGILGPAISSLVALGWLYADKEFVENSIAYGAEMAERRLAPHQPIPSVAAVAPAAAIEFGPGDAYHDPVLLIDDYRQNREKYNREESALLEKTIAENQEFTDELADN